MSKKKICLIITTLFTLSLLSQEVKNLQESFLEAEYFFMYEDYSDALPAYLQLYENMPENANIAFRIGVCYLNLSGKKNLSVSYLEAATKNISAKHKDGTISQIAAPYDALYELGNAYRINFQFDKAKEAYVKYKETLLSDDTENINFIEHEILVCDNAKSLIAKPVNFTLENMGNIFNDEKSNFNPVISADGKSFAFMVSLKFYDAVMFSRLVNGKWSSPINITPDLQSDGDFYISCLSSDGKMLFLSRDDNFNSDLYYSTFDGTKWSKAVKLNKNINTKSWESHAFISEDGNYLVFASDRPGGYGGLDIYISRKENGDWGPAVNIGPEINTPFNEDRPSLINNRKNLFFTES
jgi:tetratricopeptide (TPR) repeat protein